MAQEPEFTDLGSSDALLAYIKSISDDIEKAVIPQTPEIFLTDGQQTIGHYPVGMVLYMVNSHMKFLHHKDAEILLNDGLLNRLRIKIELFHGSQHQ